jgi:hypothetical protein
MRGRLIFSVGAITSAVPSMIQAVLVDAQAFEQQVVVVLEALGAGDGDREGVADGDRAPELEGLAHIHGAGAGNSVPRMDEISTLPHMRVADHLAELARAGELRVDVGGVDVARHHREQVDVFGAEGADQVGGVADGDLVECPVLDEIVCLMVMKTFGFAMQQSNSTENRVTNFSVRSKTRCVASPGVQGCTKPRILTLRA